MGDNVKKLPGDVSHLQRLIGRNPSRIRRLFTAASNPELRLVIQIANDLDADIIVPRRKKRDRVKDAERASATAA